MEQIRMVMECVELKNEVMKQRTEIYKKTRREKTIDFFDEFFGDNHSNTMENNNPLQRVINEDTASHFWSVILDRNIGNWNTDGDNTDYNNEVSDFGIYLLNTLFKQYKRWIKMTFKNEVCDGRENFVYGSLSERTYTEDEWGNLTRETTINPASMCIGIFGDCDEDCDNNIFLRIDYDEEWRRFYEEKEDLQHGEVIDVWDLDDDWDNNPNNVLAYCFNELLKRVGCGMTTFDEKLWRDQEENHYNKIRDNILEWLNWCDDNMTKLDFSMVKSETGIQLLLSLLCFIGSKNNLLDGDGPMAILVHNKYIEEDEEIMKKVWGGNDCNCYERFYPYSYNNHRAILKKEHQ